MQTAVISGRVGLETKRKADAVLRSAGVSNGEVIKNTWETIAATGEIPSAPNHKDPSQEQRAALDKFLSFVSALPPINPAVENMTDDEILAMRVSDYV